MEIFISDHAKLRFKRRWKFNAPIEKIAERAFKKGILLEEKGDRTYKSYKKTVFVFKKADNGMVLITLFIRQKDKRRKLRK